METADKDRGQLDLMLYKGVSFHWCEERGGNQGGREGGGAGELKFK